MRRSDSILQQYYFSGLPKAQNGQETPGWFSRVSKDLKNLFGIEDEKPKQVVLTMPQKIKISDGRKKSLTTGKQIDPNRDLVTGEYPSDRIYNIVKAAKRYGIDPYTALAIELQETGLGTSKKAGNVGHTLMNQWQDKMVPSQFTEDDSPEFQPYDTFARSVATKMQEADRLGITDPYTRLQVYNGLGRISGDTEKDYHGFKMKSIYGVPIPSGGIDMRKNPLYGKRIIDLRDNVLKPNKDLEYWIKYIKASGGPIIKDNRGQWAHPGKVTRISGSNITMDGVPYPVLAKPSFGKSKVMMPGMNYKFPGAQYVDEYPINLNLPKLDSERMGMYAEPSLDFWQGKPYFGATVGYKTPRVDLSANYMYGVPTIGARINFESGGQHGGLDRWFAEKWVDVKTGKACGRQEGEKRRSYPACRPSRRVNEDTPKTSGELSSSEREKFKRSKTSSERINYQHRRKEYGGETNEQDMANKPNNPSLWSKAKSLAKQKFDVYPSAYANGWAAKWYKSKGGTWRKAEYGMEIPYMEDGGIPDNEGFRALPPKVQQQIIDGMAFGGYIPEMGYGGAAQQAAIAIAMKKAGKKPKMPFGGLMLPGIKKRIDEAKPMLMQMAPMLMGAPPMPMMQQGGEPDGSMALGQINAAMDKLEKLRQFIQPDSDLEPWVSSKLTLMDHYADAVSDYMMYNPEATGAQEEVPMEEMRDGGIPERYKNMGFTKVGVKKNSTRPGKKWMVLAKKGSDYKVVHGGYDGMKDFSQHGSEQRKENFWNRMGGKNSSKATDPFSPLYWHKRFGTWENGGQPFLPQAQDGKMLLPKEQDFPDYETYAAALDQYLASLNPVQGDTAAVVQQQVPVAAPTTDQKSPFVLKPYEGSSIYDFMVTQGKAPEYSSRKQLAKDLGIENYRGTAEQNLSMLDMLRSSPDKLSTYTPVSGSKKVASATNNNKPSEAQETQPKPQPKKQNPAPPKLETQTEDDYVNEIAATVIGLATIGGLGIAEARQALRNIEEGKYNLSGKAKAKLTKAVNSLKSQSLASSGEKVKEVSKWYNSLPARQKNILKSLDLAEISGDIANTRPGTALKNVEAYNMLQEAKQEDAVLDAMKAAEEAKALRSFNAQKAAAVRWGKPVPTFPKLAPIASETKAGTSIFKEGLNAAMETPWLRNSIKFMKRLPLRFQEGGESVPDDDSFLENAAEWLDPTGISSWDDVARTFNDPNSGAFDRFLSVAGALPIIGKIGKGAKVVSLASDGAKAISKTKKVTNAVGKGLDIITLTKPQRWIDNKVNPFTRAFGAMTSKAGANLPRAAAVPANILVDIGRSNRAWNAVDNFIPGGTSMVRIAPQGEVVNLITPDGRLISTTTADPRVRQLYDQNLIDTTQGGYDEKTSGWRLKSGSPYGNYDYFKKSGGSTWYNNTFYQKGGSIVDYLASKGMAYDKESRKKLAEKMGIKDYNFSANKNLELLAALRQELKDSPSSKNVKSSKSTSELLSAPSMLRARPTFTPDPINFTQSVLSHMNSDKQLESGFVVDKRTNMGHVVKDGKIQESFPVLTGSNPEGTENPYSVAYLDNNPSNRVTPAGTYNMIPSSRKDRGNKSGTIYGAPGYFLQPVAAFNQKAPNSKNVAIHTTYDPASRGKLYNMSPEDRYASYGCINCRPKNIGDLTSKYFPQGDTLMVLDPQKNMYDFDFMERLQQGRGLIKKAGGEIEEGDILEVTPAQAKALREAGFEFTTE
jgi:hypothetical protein